MYDTDATHNTSSEYTARADDYPPPHFKLKSRRMFNHFDILRQRSFDNTRRVDFATLRAFGIADQFLHLTGRIGFTPAFWEIAEDSYQELTLEFLSSLELKWDPDGQPYLKVRLRNTTYRIGIVQQAIVIRCH